MTPIDPHFKDAIDAAMRDHELYGDIDDGITENGAMRAVGIFRGDSIRLFALMDAEFRGDLMEGGPPYSNALLAIIEIALSTGVHLERKRWEERA